MQKFQEHTIVSGFIKNLLTSTPLPIFYTANPYTKLIADCIYYYNGSTIYVTKSGYIHDSSAKYTELGRIPLNSSLIGATDKFISNSLYYDTKTHARLGEYLRWYRDLYGIDLFPFYNCFIPYVAEDIVLKDGYVTYLTPIRFNQKYTIATGTDSPISMMPVLYNGQGISDINEELYKYSENYVYSDTMIKTDDEENPYTDKIKKESQINCTIYFNNLLVYSLDTDSSFLYNNRKNLYLAIAMPASSKSSIVVLEGDYRNAEYRHVFNVDDESVLNPFMMNPLLVTSPILLQMNTSDIIPFSPRLIEFLVENAITSQTENHIDIARIQEQIDKYGDLFSNKGMWSDVIRYIVYINLWKNNLDKLDGNGEVNKDVENFASQGLLSYDLGKVVYTGHYRMSRRYGWASLISSQGDQYDLEDQNLSQYKIIPVVCPNKEAMEETDSSAISVSTKKIEINPKNGQSLIFINEFPVYYYNPTEGYGLTLKVKKDGQYVEIPHGNATTGGWVFAHELDDSPIKEDSFSPYNVIYIYPFYTSGVDRIEIYKDYVGGLDKNQTIEITCKVATFYIKSYKLNIIYYE